MNGLDYLAVVIYLVVLLYFGYRLRGQDTGKDYFLGSRDMGWFPLTLSTMATQLSAISFISAPAFVGMREDGGLKWLTYEFAVPLAMIFVMYVIAPALYRANVVSIYEYLERTFSRSTRLLVSLAFQIVRSFATGIVIYAPALILQAVLEIPLWQSIVVVGGITLLYSTSGGMKAVVYSDAVQMILIVAGLLLIGAFAFIDIGGIGALRQADPERLNVINTSALGFAGDEFGFWPMLFGGFVLYASYYGCDQTQAQRILSSRSEGATRALLLGNGLLRFPLVLLYCVVGLAVGISIAQHPDMAAQIPSDRPDLMMPVYMIATLPHGVLGLLLVAILSAAMSSVSSSVNSLAAVTLEDLKTLGLPITQKKTEVVLARVLSLAWGVVILLLSVFGGSIAPTVIEAINKVASAMYGPVLGVFTLAVLFKSVGAIGANAGLLTGLAVNIYLWLRVPELFWMWWNLIGWLVTLAVAFVVAKLFGADPAPAARATTTGTMDSANSRTAVFLLGAFVAMLGISWVLPGIAS